MENINDIPSKFIILIPYGIALLLLFILPHVPLCNKNCKESVGCNYAIIRLYEKTINTLFLSGSVLLVIYIICSFIQIFCLRGS